MTEPKLTTKIYFKQEDFETRRVFGEGGLTIGGHILPEVKTFRFIQKGDSAIQRARRPVRTARDSELEFVVSCHEVTEITLKLWV